MCRILDPRSVQYERPTNSCGVLLLLASCPWRRSPGGPASPGWDEPGPDGFKVARVEEKSAAQCQVIEEEYRSRDLKRASVPVHVGRCRSEATSEDPGNVLPPPHGVPGTRVLEACVPTCV